MLYDQGVRTGDWQGGVFARPGESRSVIRLRRHWPEDGATGRPFAANVEMTKVI